MKLRSDSQDLSFSQEKKKKRKLVFVSLFAIGVTLGTLSSIYLWSLYDQLTAAFSHQEQFIPTRIYSDVTRFTALQTREYVEDRLRALGYNPKTYGQSIEFTLHPVEYPHYLLPSNHPLLDLTEAKVALQFDGNSAHSRLTQITVNDNDSPDVFLEPELIATLSKSSDSKREIRSALKFEEVPAFVWKAIIAIEDQHFLEHKGLDPKGIARAFWVNLKTLSLAQGGSTITQQLVKNLMARRTKNLFRKFNELFLSILLEARFEKEKILERYLNEVYLGQVGNLEVHGVAEGAEHFFGKKLEELNLAEVALMAGLIRGPGYYSPYRYRERAIERQRLVLRKMVETGQIAEEEAKAALQLPIRLAPPQTASTKAPFFTDYLKAELFRELKEKMSEQEIIQAGFRVYSTLDPFLNAQAQRAVSMGVSQLEGRFKLPPSERLEGALISVDHRLGFIRALVGGKNYAQSNFNRILNMKRQVGSTFKPIVYLTALKQGEDPNGIPYGPAHPIEDSPWSLTFDHGKQTWTPKNYEKQYRGWVTLRFALSHSINTAAARLGHEVGVEKTIQTAQALGVTSPLPPVPSLSLGVAELSPLELLQVYATLANRGLQEHLTTIRGISQPDGTTYTRFVSHPIEAFDPGPIDLLTDMLQSVFTEGTAREARKMGFSHFAAGKTGTTSNHRDAWFAGYTPFLTTITWVGMDQSSNLNTSPAILTGANSALPIWVNYMKAAHANFPQEPFRKSEWITEVSIDTHSGKAAQSGCSAGQILLEKYLIGHEPRDSSCEPNWPTSLNEVKTN